MVHRRRLIYNTVLLTLSSLLMRCIGMSFHVWLVGRIGAAGIGLYQLVGSVTALVATFAISGIRFTTTRLVSEELGYENLSGIRSAMRRCLIYGAVFGLAALSVLWLLAEPIGFLWIGDARTVKSLCIAALGMPFVSLDSSLGGYFTACGRVWKPTLVRLTAQIAGIAMVAALLSQVSSVDIEGSCAAVTLGQLGADILSCILMFLSYCGDRRSHFSDGSDNSLLTGRMLKIALPLALSAYARSALTTFQNLLVPRGLRSAGYSGDGALAGYGTIQGMVMPVLFFPSCIMSALSELIVPELTEAQVQRDRAGIIKATGELMKLSILFSLAVGAFMFIFADELGLSIYQSAEAGRYIRIFAPLVPIMYTDMTLDGCLKGLGQQMWYMGINIIESVAGLFLIWQFLPRYALAAYIGIIYFTELFNFTLSLFRLIKVTGRPS